MIKLSMLDFHTFAFYFIIIIILLLLFGSDPTLAFRSSQKYCSIWTQVCCMGTMKIISGWSQDSGFHVHHVQGLTRKLDYYHVVSNGSRVSFHLRYLGIDQISNTTKKQSLGNSVLV